jgi:hypothetical protein
MVSFGFGAIDGIARVLDKSTRARNISVTNRSLQQYCDRVHRYTGLLYYYYYY